MGSVFPGSPVFKTLSFNVWNVGSIPDCGDRIPLASLPKTPKHKTETIW